MLSAVVQFLRLIESMLRHVPVAQQFLRHFMLGVTHQKNIFYAWTTKVINY